MLVITLLMGNREEVWHKVGFGPLGGQVFLTYTKFWPPFGIGWLVHAEDLVL